MHAIVSKLDREHYYLVEKLWVELRENFNIKGIYATPVPHFSWQVAEKYDLSGLKGFLESFCSRTVPFSVSTGGLGIFSGVLPVLFVPVVRTAMLSNLHEELWRGCGALSEGISGLYAPEKWQPHITLAHDDIHAGNMCKVIRFLQERNYRWQIKIESLSFIYDSGEKQEVLWDFALSGK